ncbi:hypothetical protein O9X98_05355 [Agrobacterium salinitolerans]|nr:hypothetical protein [Agrobacterium salinitolerans]
MLAMMRGTAEIAEVNPTLAPLACRVPGNKWATYRYMDGHFYALVDTADGLERRLGGALTIMMADVARDVEGVRRDLIWPRDALEGLRKLRHSMPLKQAADLDAFRLIQEDVFELPEYLSEPNTGDIAHWEARAADFASTVFVCDGGVWAAAPEPVMVLTDTYAMPADSSLYDKLDGSFSSDVARSANLNVYPLTDVDGLRAELAADERPDRLVAVTTEVFMPEVFGEAFPIREMDRLATVACERFRIFYCNEANRPLRTTPADLSRSYFELIGVHSAGDADPDALNQSLVNFTNTLEFHNASPGKLVDARIGEFSKALSANVGRISSYWNDRPVDLPVRHSPTI